MPERTWRLHAIGRSGRVTLELLDSTDDGPTTYRLVLDSPSIYLHVAISGPDAVPALSQFMREPHGQKQLANLQLGTLDGVPVLLVQDHEFADRFFLCVGGEARLFV